MNAIRFPPGMPPAARAAALAARSAELLSPDGLGDVAVTRQGHMDHDPYVTPHAVAPKWLTWGQQQNLPFVLVGAGEGTVPQQATTQLVRVEYHMPTTWSLKVLFDFSQLTTGFPPGTEIVVGYQLIYGVGQASIQQNFSFTSTANAAGAFPQVIDDETFPAQHISLNAFNAEFISGAGVPAVDGVISVTALCAPMVA